MFDSIDALDCVSLLLGAALAYVLAQGLKQRRPDLPPHPTLLLFLGFGLILAYAMSEALHALRAARGG